MSDATISRRKFMQTMAAAAPIAYGLSSPTGWAQSASRTLKVGLIGCGGRGNGALQDCLNAAKHLGVNLHVAATADVLKQKADSTGNAHGVPPERRFDGMDAYNKLIATDVELVLLATPPNFRPMHFEAAVTAGKHVFMEKPVAVDAPGGRRVIAAGEKATATGLAVVAGTQRRHAADYQRNQFAVANGAIGKIVGGTVMWCGTVPWIRGRQEGDTDADYLLRNWVNFTEISGDHIVEQHVHNIDVANWFIGHPPVQALGFGGRHQRRTGNQYDFFSVDFDYGDGCHIHSMCSQRKGCYTRVGEFFRGTHGEVWGGGKMSAGKDVSVPELKRHGNPMVQEHVALLEGILNEKPINEARHVAESTLAAIMGRLCAYSGEMIRFKDLTENKDSKWYNLTLTPTAEDFEKGGVVAPPDDVISFPRG